MKHVVDASADVLCPTSHRVQEVSAVVFVKKPCGQKSHSVSLARIVLYVPGTHGKQKAWPGSSWYLPVSHRVHADAPGSGASYPAGQSEHQVDPFEAAYVPGMHCRHSDDPVRFEYLPVLHCVQPSLPLMLYHPAGHTLHAVALDMSL